MSDQWTAADDFITEHQLGADPELDSALRRNVDAGLPAIDVSRAHAEFLAILVRTGGARRVLEIGTLGGYSTIALARAVGAEGSVTTIELSLHHAEVAADNLVAAGMADRVEVQVGPALELLAEMLDEPPAPFDFVFIDADKANNPEYFMLARRLCREGALIVVDNVVRQGQLIDEDDQSPEAVGNRQLLALTGNDPSIQATTLQTVGVKGWDAFVLAIV